MENVLHKPNPPPLLWDLVIIVNEDANPKYLRKAHLIIKSYLESRLIKQSIREKKGVHRFTLVSVGEPIDKSILRELSNETWPHLKVEGGHYYVNK